MKKTLLSTAALFGLAFAGSAMAQGLDFATLDADMSGEISFEELRTALPDITQEDFDRVDVDGSGGLSQAEFNAILTPPAEGGNTTGGDTMGGDTMAPESPAQ